MGQLYAHFIVGAFLLLLGTYWTLSIFARYYESRNEPSGKPYLNSCLHPWRRRYYVDAYMFFIIFALRVLAYLLFEWQYALTLKAEHHFSMYAFGLASISFALLFTKVKSAPPNLDYVLLAMFFTVKATLFYFHNMHHMAGPSPEVMSHTFVYITAYSVSISFLVELTKPESILAGLSRGYFVILEGLWFIQVAFYLYPASDWVTILQKPNLDPMLVPILFNWTCLLGVLLMSVLGVVQNYRYMPIQDHSIKRSKDEEEARLIRE